MDNNRLRRAFTLVHAAMLKDPRDPQIRLQLAELYRMLGDQDFAQIEYLNALKLDPENEAALDALNQLESLSF